MTGPPEFRDLFEEELSAEERARLERVHELLVAAGPPPELPPSLAEAPDRSTRSPSWLPRRRLGAVLALAATVVVVAFLGGYIAGYTKNDFNSEREVSLSGTAAAPRAHALIKLGKPDQSGNWPMKVTVQGLPKLPEHGYYVLYLRHEGTRLLRCGSFNAEAGATTVSFTVPYRVERSDAWIVTLQEPGMHDPGQIVLET